MRRRVSYSRKRYENELARLLWSQGFFVCRCPSSGSRNPYPCLDLLAFKDGKVYAIEVKTTSNEVKNVTNLLSSKEKEKARALEGRGAIVLICIRKMRGGWECYTLDNKAFHLTNKT